MGRHHLAGGRNSLRRLQNERLHSPPQTLRLQRDLTPAFVEAADRGGLFFSSLLFSSLLSALCVSAFSALNFFSYFLFSNFFFLFHPLFLLFDRYPQPKPTRLPNPQLRLQLPH